MASLHLLPYSPLSHSRSLPLPLLLRPSRSKLSTKFSIDGLISDAETAKPARRRKRPASSSPSKKPSRSRKAPSDDEAPREVDTDDEIEAYDDGMDFPYDDPPLICCFGAAQKEFLPTVRVHDNQMHPDIYSQWKMLQWDPPEFARAPGGPASNVAISHVRLGGRAAFMGKVGRDSFGDELVLMMNKEHVQTRAVKFDEKVKTGCSYMRVKFDESGRMRMETVKESAEDSLHGSDLNFAVLKEVIFLLGLSYAFFIVARESGLLHVQCGSEYFQVSIDNISECHSRAQHLVFLILCLAVQENSRLFSSDSEVFFSESGASIFSYTGFS